MKRLFVLLISIPLIFISCEKEEEPCDPNYGIVTKVTLTGSLVTNFRITVVNPCSGVQTTRDVGSTHPEIGDEYWIGWQNWG